MTVVATCACCSTSRPTLPPLNASTTRLLEGLRAVLNIDILAPTNVERALDMRFASEPAEEVSVLGCSNPYSDRHRLRTRHAPIDSWFRGGPDGQPNRPIPGIMINRAEVLSAPALDYRTEERENCSGFNEPMRQATAQLSFPGMPGFACVGGNDIVRVFAQAQTMMATEGTVHVFVEAPNRETSGRIAEFTFRPGVRCAVALVVDQLPRNTARYQRAFSRSQSCRNRANQEFCATHPPFTYGEGAILNQMALHAIRACGTFDSSFQAELSPSKSANTQSKTQARSLRPPGWA